jgi:TolB-like protein/DNA-binding winged helix-turn-helix (wHTH) protein
MTTIMAALPAQSQAQMQSKRLRFGLYLLDLDRGCLFYDGKEVTLRPKTFAVLLHLVENAGRLVSKDELFAAVWPNIAVTDDALVQSVGELRRALGDDGPHLIKTIPRRGYRFECDVSIVAPTVAFSDTTPFAATSRDVAQAPELGAEASISAPRTAVRASRSRVFAAISCVIALVAAALWISTGPKWSTNWSVETGAKPAIAILPMTNQSGDSAREYFADGLTQDIINAMGRFSELTVISWNAVSPYKGKSARPGEIARALAVRYQVEGSVRQTGERVRVNARLVDTDARVLWSGSYDEALTNLFALQDKITTQIAGALAIRVTQLEQRRASTKATENLEAYDYVLRARPALQRPARPNMADARVLLRRAIELDPNYAAAYAALAETYFTATSMGWAESPTEFLDRAEELANKSLSLDVSEVRARVILGRIHIFYHRYDKARAEMERAIAINPSDAHAIAGRGNILMWLGQTDAAIEDLELAQRIDPELNAMDRFALSLAYYLRRRYDAAIEQAELNLRRTQGANFSRIILAAAQAQLNRAEDAARAVTLIQRIDPTFDPREFGTKFLNSDDLEHVREGLGKAGLYKARPSASGDDR